MALERNLIEKHVLVMNMEETNPILIERFQKHCKIYYSDDVPPQSYSFPNSGLTFIFLEFAELAQLLWHAQDRSGFQQKISWLAEFAEAHEGAHFILLHHEVDEALGEVNCEVQRCVEAQLKRKVDIGFATSWKNAANYMMDVAQKLSRRGMANVTSRFQKDLQSDAVKSMMNKEIEMLSLLQQFAAFQSDD